MRVTVGRRAAALELFERAGKDFVNVPAEAGTTSGGSDAAAAAPAREERCPEGGRGEEEEEEEEEETFGLLDRPATRALFRQACASRDDVAHKDLVP